MIGAIQRLKLRGCVRAANRLMTILLAIRAVPARAQPPSPPPAALWYSQPATNWVDALPIGNGRLGAMVFGGTGNEHLQLNEETLWSGGPYDPVVVGAHDSLAVIRQLLFAGRTPEAHDLFGRTMMGRPFEQMKYQPLGDLWIRLPGHDQATDYRRTLDLDAATVTVRYRVGDVHYTREMYVSAVDQVIVVRLTADQPGAITGSLELRGARNQTHSNYGTDYFQMDALAPDTLRLTGKSSDYLGIPGRLRYEARAVVRHDGGSVTGDHRAVRIDGATSVTIVVAAATSFVNYRDVSADPAARVRATLVQTATRTPDQMLREHQAEHQRWFRRVELSLGASSPEARALPTDARIRRYADHPDPELAALYYQFGRYILIASSRPGTQAANLQGIWNDNSNPWWDAKYTININLPMNYWPAESANLAEMTQPLDAMLRDLAIAGTATAREHWGARGWVVHQNTDLWRSTTPMDGPSWGAWPVGGAWLMTALYEHYRYAADTGYLRSIYPLLRDQARFLLDILVEDPRTHRLVTAPSNSPENFPAWPGNGVFFDEVSGSDLQARTMAAGPTMDMQIIRQVLTDFTDAAGRLGLDSAQVAEANRVRPRLAPNQIGRHGQLQEWQDDWEDLEPNHRHNSQLWGLFPGSEISPDGTPALARAARVSLERRGIGGCGWSYAWRMGLRARLREAPAALAQFRSMLVKSSLPNFFSLCGKAMQVDGTLGATAAIAEMLLQSQEGMLRLLPALPDEWQEGSLRGLRARGAFEAEMVWSAGRLRSASIVSLAGAPCVVQATGLVGVRRNGRAVRVRRVNPTSLAFATEAGSRYELRFAP